MDLQTRLPFFLLILAFSVLNNLAIPFILYFKRFGRKGYGGQGGCNFWGVVMDGFIAGAINIIAVDLLFEIKPAVSIGDIILVLSAGLLSMAAAHTIMSLKQWEIWIMPRPWQWNEGGYWHMFSMTVQMAFVYYPIWLIIKNPLFFSRETISLPVIAGFALAFFFLACLEAGRQGLKIGRFTISSRPW